MVWLPERLTTVAVRVHKTHRLAGSGLLCEERGAPSASGRLLRGEAPQAEAHILGPLSPPPPRSVSVLPSQWPALCGLTGKGVGGSARCMEVKRLVPEIRAGMETGCPSSARTHTHTHTQAPCAQDMRIALRWKEKGALQGPGACCLDASHRPLGLATSVAASQGCKWSLRMQGQFISEHQGLWRAVTAWPSFLALNRRWPCSVPDSGLFPPGNFCQGRGSALALPGPPAAPVWAPPCSLQPCRTPALRRPGWGRGASGRPGSQAKQRSS